ncbi:DUF6221 family protein [Actinomadura nitritigenes]|jgi:hypothetical protein|uniref:DUF6221 family protein n=1 Tax=Actinomadura TaxID=1988 RepID=UPI0016847B91|nr:DUF6221 family protein [Actinomadura sp. RB99]MBD2899106.1 hypothetical protein [Actinomadura sp. RB99]
MDLVEFLRARLAKDEQVARACSGASWTAGPSGAVHLDADGEPAVVASAETEAYAEHIARHDPSRALQEVAARRQLVDDHEKHAWIIAQGRATPEQRAAQAVREQTLRLIALAYAHHPDYNEEWRA